VRGDLNREQPRSEKINADQSYKVSPRHRELEAPTVLKQFLYSSNDIESNRLIRHPSTQDRIKSIGRMWNLNFDFV
jgi:hypothetical protein